MRTFLYGLQRSGTNILQEWCESNLKLKFDNVECTDRKSPCVKHFRLYDKKQYVIDEYKTNHTVDTIEQLDNLTGGDEKLYVVIYKSDIYGWLDSIKRWAKHCKCKNISISAHVHDYMEFINKWKSFEKHPRVHMITYEDFINKNVNGLLDFLNIKTTETLSWNHAGSRSLVKNTIQFYTNKQYMNNFTDEERNIIKDVIITYN